MSDRLYQILRKYLNKIYLTLNRIKNKIPRHFVKYVQEVYVIGAETIVDVDRFILKVIIIINNYIIYDKLYITDVHDRLFYFSVN